MLGNWQEIWSRSFCNFSFIWVNFSAMGMELWVFMLYTCIRGFLTLLFRSALHINDSTNENQILSESWYRKSRLIFSKTLVLPSVLKLNERRTFNEVHSSPCQFCKQCLRDPYADHFYLKCLAIISSDGTDAIQRSVLSNNIIIVFMTFLG